VHPPEHIPTETIRNIVKDICNYSGTQKDKERIYTKKYPEFKELYPSLFDMVCENDFDISKFNYMMDLRESVMRKERDIESASVEVGKKFFNIYVEPKLPKT